MKFAYLLSIALSVAGVSSVSAQTPARHRPRHPNTKVSIIGSHEAVDSMKTVVKTAFEENAPADRSIEGIPRFAIVGKERNFYMGIGANMKLNGVYDWGGVDAGSTTNFSPALFQPATPGNGSGVTFSAQESNFYINIVALPGKKDKFSLFLAMNFKNPNYGLQLSHFYARYRGLTIGYTDSPFKDGDAVPYTIDDQGPCGAVSSSSVVAYWTQELGKGFSCLAGFDAPGHTMTYNDHVNELTKAFVALPVAAQYRWGDGSHVRLSALLRPMKYRDNVADTNRVLTGWGVQVSGLWSFIPKFCVYYDVAAGKGIADYINDASGTGADATPSFIKKGRENVSACWGCSFGLSYDILKQMSAQVVYSRLRVYPHSESLVPDSGYRYGQSFTANLIYHVNEFVTVGAEYNWGLKSTFEDGKLHLNRLQALFSLAF